MKTRSGEHEKWMGRALALARRGVGLTRPNPPVGAVIVKNGRILGEGYHRGAGTDHAEIVALRRAGRRAKGATLYVTLEPCSTRGRTGPCTAAVLSSGVSRVVAAIRDPNPAHFGRGLRLLRRAGVDAVEGVCRTEAEALVAPFAKWIRSGMPYVTLKLASSLDGRIADRQGHSRWLTGPRARARVHGLRRSADAIMVGARTVLADDPQLLPRPAKGRQPWRVIVDRQGLTPPGARVLNDGQAAGTIIATTRRCPAQRSAAYRRAGTRVMVLPAHNGDIVLRHLLRELGELGLLHVLCEGGGELAEALIQQRLVDEFVLFLAPGLLGAGGIPAFAGRGWLLARMPKMCITSCAQLGADLMIRAQPVSQRP